MNPLSTLHSILNISPYDARVLTQYGLLNILFKRALETIDPEALSEEDKKLAGKRAFTLLEESDLPVWIVPYICHEKEDLELGVKWNSLKLLKHVLTHQQWELRPTADLASWSRLAVPVKTALSLGNTALAQELLNLYAKHWPDFGVYLFYLWVKGQVAECPLTLKLEFNPSPSSLIPPPILEELKVTDWRYFTPKTPIGLVELHLMFKLCGPSVVEQFFAGCQERSTQLLLCHYFDPENHPFDPATPLEALDALFLNPHLAPLLQSPLISEEWLLAQAEPLRRELKQSLEAPPLIVQQLHKLPIPLAIQFYRTVIEEPSFSYWQNDFLYRFVGQVEISSEMDRDYYLFFLEQLLSVSPSIHLEDLKPAVQQLACKDVELAEMISYTLFLKLPSFVRLNSRERLSVLKPWLEEVLGLYYEEAVIFQKFFSHKLYEEALLQLNFSDQGVNLEEILKTSVTNPEVIELFKNHFEPLHRNYLLGMRERPLEGLSIQGTVNPTNGSIKLSFEGEAVFEGYASEKVLQEIALVAILKSFIDQLKADVPASVIDEDRVVEKGRFGKKNVPAFLKYYTTEIYIEIYTLDLYTGEVVIEKKTVGIDFTSYPELVALLDAQQNKIQALRAEYDFNYPTLDHLDTLPEEATHVYLSPQGSYTLFYRHPETCKWEAELFYGINNLESVKRPHEKRRQRFRELKSWSIKNGYRLFAPELNEPIERYLELKSNVSEPACLLMGEGEHTLLWRPHASSHRGGWLLSNREELDNTAAILKAASELFVETSSLKHSIDPSKANSYIAPPPFTLPNEPLVEPTEVDLNELVHHLYTLTSQPDFAKQLGTSLESAISTVEIFIERVREGKEIDGWDPIEQEREYRELRIMLTHLLKKLSENSDKTNFNSFVKELAILGTHCGTGLTSLVKQFYMREFVSETHTLLNPCEKALSECWSHTLLRFVENCLLINTSIQAREQSVHVNEYILTTLKEAGWSVPVVETVRHDRFAEYFGKLDYPKEELLNFWAEGCLPLLLQIFEEQKSARGGEFLQMLRDFLQERLKQEGEPELLKILSEREAKLQAQRELCQKLEKKVLRLSRSKEDSEDSSDAKPVKRSLSQEGGESEAELEKTREKLIKIKEEHQNLLTNRTKILFYIDQVAEERGYVAEDPVTEIVTLTPKGLSFLIFNFFIKTESTI